MNKRGQTLGISIIVAITIFLVGMVVVNILTPEVTSARSATGLDCSNSDISDGTKLTCLVVDLAIPYFFVIVISLAGGWITSRLIL